MRRVLAGARLVAGTTIVAALVGGAGCAHQSPPRWTGPKPGHYMRPYAGLPWYLERVAMLPPPGIGVGRFSDRVPVAGHWPLPDADARDEIRVLLARVDVSVIGLRGIESPAPSDVALVQSAIADVARLARGRPDLVAESEEILDLSSVLPDVTPFDRERALNRILEVTDLIRSQLIATA